MPTFRGDALVIFRAKEVVSSGLEVGNALVIFRAKEVVSSGLEVIFKYSGHFSPEDD